MITKERIKVINKIDVQYRDLEDFDDQFQVMVYVLNCLSDKQLKETKQLIKYVKKERKNA
tara:strand:+ start:365 stop:544 length:180 start_codon:yes stop_codon:yes gene_type:complete